ncbi:MAG: phosphate acyltransferase PlsX [Elusimicrobiota bacterium]|jgi:glycerol-3-phosphate acyltransferase PlsX|nr:phosphate acyltransferase PlsX [Elusimicrobiota bacterium]
MIIALDAMGGDFGLSSSVEGAVLASKTNSCKVILVGKEELIRKEFLKFSKKTDIRQFNIEIVNATEIIDMDEQPAKAVRQKKDSSLCVCARLVSEGKANAFVSMGNSGAVMAAALFHLKRTEGVLRPTLATPMPTLNGYCLVSDSGANVDCKPEYLMQFGIMASLYCEKILNIKNPRIGIVSNGEESSKGNELTLAAFELLKKSGLNFLGNIEGRDIPKGKADVAVCDGFVGNVILKFGEGLAAMILQLVKSALKNHPFAWASLPFLWLAIKDLRKKVDYSEVGGVPLLGVNGVCVIGHGSSNSKAVKNAILAAAKALKHNLSGEIKSAIENYNKRLLTND